MTAAFSTELKKLRRRHVWLLCASCLALDFVWCSWAFSKMADSELEQGYYMLLLDLPLINAITLPVILAAAASRICDIENKGDTYKLLCTMQKKESIFHSKLLLGGIFVMAFTVLQTGLMAALGKLFRFTQAIPWSHVFFFAFMTFTVSFILYLIQQVLSLMMESQLFPLFAGLFGAFTGLFSWFFPTLPIRYVVPWGYYCVGVSVNFTWDQATRISTYYTVPFPWLWAAGFMVFGVLVYFVGKHLFLEKEV